MNTFLTSFEYMTYHKVVNKCQSNFVLCIDCFIAQRVSLASYYCKEVFGFPCMHVKDPNKNKKHLA